MKIYTLLIAYFKFLLYLDSNTCISVADYVLFNYAEKIFSQMLTVVQP